MKRRLYNLFFNLAFSFFSVFSFILFIFKKINFFEFFLFFSSISILFFIFKKLSFIIENKFNFGIEKLYETRNLLLNEIEERKKILDVLPSQIERVSFIFDISKELVALFDIDTILNFCFDKIKNLFRDIDNVSISLLEDNKLSRVRFIKESKIDEIDIWVLKHNTSLLIEDITKDFRFNSNNIFCFTEYLIYSMIVSPLSIGRRTFGLIRIDSKKPCNFSFEDLRLLRTISDLVVLVLEKAFFIDKIRETTIRDPLTSVYLRDYFLNRFLEELERSKISNVNLGVIMLDIDDFKKINDRFGHTVGDIVLKRLVSILKDTLPKESLICRFGGEEFILYIVGYDKNRLIEISYKILDNIRNSTISFRKKEINFTVSIGAILVPSEADNLEDILNKVDSLLYQAKREGKDRVCFIR